MTYAQFTTFTAEQSDGVLTVTIDFAPVNLQGQEMLADLNTLALRLERDANVKVVVFQSAHPEIWVAHYDTNLLKDMSTEAVSREEAQLLDLQAVLERISKLHRRPLLNSRGLRVAVVMNLPWRATCTSRRAESLSSCKWKSAWASCRAAVALRAWQDKSA